MLNIMIVIFLLIFCFAYWYFDEIRTHIWQNKLAGKTLTRKQRKLLLQVMPIYRNMTDSERQTLEKQIMWFLAHKEVIGCDGLTVTPDMALVIAANACLLVLNKPWPLYPNVKQILLYPSAYYANETNKDSAGLVSYHEVVRQGESWPGGTLVLSWHDVLEGNRLPQDGHNLVFHEFAHQLDQQTGATTGTPALKNKSMYQRWKQEFSRAFNLLKTQLAYGMPNFIHRYGATNEAEFFAVLTETFIEQPHQLKAYDASIYHLMSEYYEFDPMKWVKEG